MIKFQLYTKRYEKSWVYCKALAYLFSDFFDDISRQKDDFSDLYEDSIELIALDNGKVVGLLDIGIYSQENSRTYPYYSCDKVAYFANLAVHPDYQHQGIAGQLFKIAEELLIEKKVEALAIFTRGGEEANYLYQKWGAKLIVRDWLVIGTSKNLEQDFRFRVNVEEGRLAFERDNGELAYYQREGHYIVSKEKDLSLFDIDQVYEERTYLKLYEREK